MNMTGGGRRRHRSRRNRILLGLLVAVQIHSAHRIVRFLGTTRRLSSMVEDEDAVVVDADFFTFTSRVTRVLPKLRHDDDDGEEKRGRRTRGGNESEGEIDDLDLADPPATTTAVVRFYSHGDSRRCHLNVTDLRYLGCGMDGHAYEAPMDSLDGDVDPRSTRRRRVVIKVLTSKIDPEAERPPPPPRKFVGDGEEDERRRRGRLGNPVTSGGLYRRIMSGLPASNSTIVGGIADVESAEMRLALAMGTADVPLDDLHSAVNRAIVSSAYNCPYDVLRPPSAASSASAHNTTAAAANGTITGQQRLSVTAKILPMSPGGRLHLKTVRGLDPVGRRGVVRDLVRIHRHMFLRGVVHCDISLWHYYHSTGVDENVTTLIDFERFRYRNTEGTANARDARAFETMLLRQFWQVMAVIGTVCSPPDKMATTNGDGEGFVIPNNVCLRGNWDAEYTSNDLVPRLVTALENCGFDRTMGWNGGALNDTAGMYDELVAWTGGWA